VQRRPRWTTSVAVAAITVLVGVGVTVAVRQPIAAPAPVSQRAAPLPDAVSPSTAEHPTPSPLTTTSEAAATAEHPTPSPLTTTSEAAATAEHPTPSPLTTTSEAAVPSGPGASSTLGSPSTTASLTPVSPPSLPVQSVPAQRTADAQNPVASGQPCRPVRFTMSGLGIDANVVTLSMTAEGDLGTPSDANRTSAGWFPSVLAGASAGTVLMDGHTYHDGSALFDPTFKQQVRAGMVMRLSCTDGHSFSYRVAEIILDLSPASYPSLVKRRNLYSASGPAQLVMITCTDYIPVQRVWANRAVVIATPIS
jgi:hypothetical protein